MTENIKAYELAKKQKEISISEFFLKNRHLLGFDNPTRALMMVVKEAVDNSLDAADEMKVLPEIKIEIQQINEDRFNIIVEDNGPGIIKQQIPNIFGKLLYGSKFHTLKQNRGQQGLGISAAVLYSQLTTGKSTKIYSIISPKKPAHYFELQIDTKKNEPNILKDNEINWSKDHGTKIEIEIEGRYLKGKQSVDEYIKETAIVNPHATFIYINPEKERFEYLRVTDKLPHEAREIKPHPYGIELGQLMKMFQDTRANTLQGFLQSEFSRIGELTAKEICSKAKLKTDDKPKKLDNKQIELLFKSCDSEAVMPPVFDTVLEMLKSIDCDLEDLKRVNGMNIREIAGLMKESTTARLLFNPTLRLYSPDFVMEEFMKYSDTIQKKMKRTRGEFITIMHQLYEIIIVVPEEEYEKYIEDAGKISPDDKDVMYFALALKLRCIIWSNDAKLKEQDKIIIYNTTEILGLLNE